MNFSHRISWVIIISLELSIDGFLNIEFNGIVSSCDSLNIEVDELGFLEGLDIIKVHNGVQIDEDCSASGDQTEDLSVVVMSMEKNARSLHVNESIATAFTSSVVSIDESSWIGEIELTFFFAFASC